MAVPVEWRPGEGSSLLPTPPVPDGCELSDGGYDVTAVNRAGTIVGQLFDEGCEIFTAVAWCDGVITPLAG